MQKHWYIIYTKKKSEKKVVASLKKHKIENYCPVNCRQIMGHRKMKMVHEPLFACNVFVYIHESQINVVKQLHNVINFVYWKADLAIIQNEEIEEIREFVTFHQNIRLEKSRMNLNSQAPVIDHPSYLIDGKVLMVRNKFIKVKLPSLGYVMVAEKEGEGEGVMGRRPEIKEKDEAFFSNFGIND